MAKLRPAFKIDGTVTAGNASGINDGAASFVVAGEKAVQEHGIEADRANCFLGSSWCRSDDYGHRSGSRYSASIKTGESDSLRYGH